MATINTDIHREVIEKAGGGSRKAQKKLYELYAKAMFNICYRMMNNQEEAEDMLQEAFIEVFRRLNSFRFESTFGAWIKRIVINKCINELKRKQLPLEYNDSVYQEDYSQEDPEERSPALSVEKIKMAMGLLPDGYRVVFSLYLLEGYDHSEIAEIMGITESTSKSQLARAKKKVVNILKAGEFDMVGN